MRLALVEKAVTNALPAEFRVQNGFTEIKDTIDIEASAAERFAELALMMHQRRAGADTDNVIAISRDNDDGPLGRRKITQIFFLVTERAVVQIRPVEEFGNAQAGQGGQGRRHFVTCQALDVNGHRINPDCTAPI